MMANKPQAGIDLNVNKKKADKDLKDFVRSFGSFSTGLNQSLELVGKGYALVAGAAGKVASAIQDYTSAANVQIEAEAKLRLALEQQGKLTDANFAKWTRFASGIQNVTKEGDEATIALQAQLLQLGVAEESLGNATEATIGFSKVMGTGLNESAKIVSKVIKGNVGALKEYGIEARDAADATDQLRSFFEIAKVEAKNFGGRTTQLANAWGDYNEAMGKTIAESEPANAFIVALKDSVSDLTTFMDGPAGQKVIDWFFKTMATGLEAAVVAISFWVQGAHKLRKEVALMMGETFVESIDENGKTWIQNFTTLTAGFEKRMADIAAGKTDVTAGDKGPQGAKGPQGRPSGPGGDKAGDDNIKRMAAEELRILEQRARFVMDADAARIEQAQSASDALVQMTADQYDYQRELMKSFERDERRSAQEKKDRLRDDARDFKELFGSQVAAVQGTVNALSGAVGNSFAELIAGNGEGTKKLNEQFGDIVSGLGQTLVQMGIAATAMGVLSIFAPAAAGGATPAAIAAGAATAAVGASLIGVGKLMGGGGSSAGASSTAGRASGGGGGGGRAPVSAASGMAPSGMPELGGQAVSVVVNFNRPVVNERATARELAKILMTGRQLRPAGL